MRFENAICISKFSKPQSEFDRRVNVIIKLGQKDVELANEKTPGKKS